MQDKLIVIIDDEEDVRETLTDLIEVHTGANVVAYSSLIKFFTSLDGSDAKIPNLIISDIHMPTGSGLRITHELKERSLIIPVLFISSMVDVVPPQDNITILRKPVIPSELMEIVENIINAPA